MTTILAAMESELLVASRENSEWRTDVRLADRSPRCLASDPLRPELVYCGTSNGGIWRSTDAGESWEQVGEGVLPGQITAVAVSPVERAGGWGVVYAGTEPTALYRSENRGETWRELAGRRALPSAPEWSFPPRPWTSHVRAIASDPSAEGKVYVAVEAGALVRSPDGGETWQDHVPDGPHDTHTLATHPRAPGRVY